MATINATATLTGIGQAIVHEQPSDTINAVSPSPPEATIEFFHGVLRAQGSDTTFTTTAPWKVTFASTDVSSVTTNDRVYATDANGSLFFGDVTGVSSNQVTVGSWYRNELAPSLSSTAPTNGSYTVINVKPVQLSYTTGAVVHAPVGNYRYTTSDAITFNAHTVMPKPRYAAAYRWDMGDGTILTGREVTHQYLSESAFRRVLLTVIDDLGKEIVIGEQVYVLAPVIVPPNPFADALNYIPADSGDHSPSQLLTVLGGGAGYGLSRDPNVFTYGQLYLPSLGLGNNFEVVQEWFTGANSAGTLRTFSGDQSRDFIMGCNGRFKPWPGQGIHTTLGAPLFYDGSTAASIPITSSAGFPSTGTIRLISGTNYMRVTYNSLTTNSLDNTSLQGQQTDLGFTYNWPADTVVQIVVDDADQTHSWNVLGFFGWWNVSGNGFGIYYADYAAHASWQDFGSGPDGSALDTIIVDIGRLGMQTTLSADWTVDISTYAGSPIDVGSIPVVDSSVFPDSTFNTGSSSDFRLTIFEGAPQTIFDVGSTQNYIQLGSYQKPDGVHLEGGYYGGSNRLSGGTTHTFPAGTKVVAPDRSGIPLVDGQSYNIGLTTDFFFNNVTPVGVNRFIPGTDSRQTAINSTYWTKLRCIGNDIWWELWREDPSVGGSTYACRMHVTIGTASGIAKLGAAMPTCMFGPMGWYESVDGSKLTDWSYTIL